MTPAIPGGNPPKSLAVISHAIPFENVPETLVSFLRAITAEIPSGNALEILARMLGESLVEVSEGILAIISRAIHNRIPRGIFAEILN